MPSNYDDTDAFIKSLGRKPPPDPAIAPPPKPDKPAATPAPSIGPPAAEASPAAPASTETDFRPSARHAAEWRGGVTRGFERGATRFGLTIGDLAEKAIPGTKEKAKQFFPSLGGLAQQAREFTAQKPEGTAESMGEVAGEVTPGMLMRIPGLGRMTSRGILAATRPAATPTFVRGMGWVGQGKMPPRWARTAAKWTGRGVEAAQTTAGSAAAGAAANPNDPASGALAGMAGGFAGRGAGAFLHSPLGRGLGGLAATEGAFYGIHKATGLPYYPLIGPIATHRYLLGRPLRRRGDSVFDSSGRFMGRLHPAIMGYVTSRVAEGEDITGTIADRYRQFMPEQSNAQEPRPQKSQQ